jgi:hypothetical protein
VEELGWRAFLTALMSPGFLSVVVGVALSYVVEYWEGYRLLDGRWKRLVFAGLCTVIPITGAGLFCLSGYGGWVDVEGVWWPALWAGGAVFFAGQVAHARKL